MTVIRPNSISGISSITGSGGDISIFRADGTAADVIVNNITSGVITATHYGSGANLTNLPAANLTGALPAISAANLTSIPAANITGTLPAISAANLTNVPAANITGTLPAIDGSALTGVGVGTADSINTSGIITATAFVPTAQGSLSHRNILINGSCAVSQRGTSFSGTGFTLDRYYVGSGDYSVAQVTDVPSNSGLTYSLRISRTASTTGYLTFQMIELPATGQAGQFYNGAKLTLSGYVKGTSGATIVPTLRFSTGTGGSNGSNFTRTEGAFTCNGSWQPFTFHFTVDENVGGSDKCVQSYFTFVTTSTGQNVFFTGLQLESGEVNTPFEHRSYGEELTLCYRYFQKDLSRRRFWGSGNVSNRRFPVVYPVEMRDTPSVSFTSTSIDSGSASANSITRQGYYFNMSGSGRYYEWSHELNAEL